MTYCMCEKCGNKATVDTSVVLTSDPPKYNYSCPACGNKGYIVCYDAKDDNNNLVEEIQQKVEELTIAIKNLSDAIANLEKRLTDNNL